MQVATRAYAFWYVGDYDSAAWLYEMLQPRWDDAGCRDVAISQASHFCDFLRFSTWQPAARLGRRRGAGTAVSRHI